jgi:uncharacterized protein (DUF1778 family)
VPRRRVVGRYNQFLIKAALKEAQAVINREEVIRLSPREWSWLLDLIKNPPEPNAKLKAAMTRYHPGEMMQILPLTGNHNQQEFATSS